MSTPPGARRASSRPREPCSCARTALGAHIGDAAVTRAPAVSDYRHRVLHPSATRASHRAHHASQRTAAHGAGAPCSRRRCPSSRSAGRRARRAGLQQRGARRVAGDCAGAARRMNAGQALLEEPDASARRWHRAPPRAPRWRRPPSAGTEGRSSRRRTGERIPPRTKSPSWVKADDDRRRALPSPPKPRCPANDRSRRAARRWSGRCVRRSCMRRRTASRSRRR